MMAALPRRPNFRKDKRSGVLACTSHVSASIVALADGEIGAKRQFVAEGGRTEKSFSSRAERA
jgi:hypothetical protein